MNEDSRKLWMQYIEKASTVVLGILLLLFPLVFTNKTTDLFVLPKEGFLIFAVLVLMLLYGARTFFAQNLRITRTPFDFPVLLFAGFLLLSSFFSIARFDSLYNFIPVLFAAFSYFAITYNLKNERSQLVLVLSLLGGGVLISLIALFNFLKIYVIPFDFTKVQTFTTLGSILDQTIYLGFLLAFSLYFVYPYIKKGRAAISTNSQEATLRLVGFSLASIILLVGFTISKYILLKLQPPVILPLATGFQTAFAAISQDGPRVIQGFLFGSGFGEFSIAFLRFKQAIFNTYPNIWSLTFFRSTSFVLELLATSGILGFISFLFLAYRVVKDKKLFFPLIIVFATAFILPFGFYHIALMFFILGLYAALRSLSNTPGYFEVELSLVASKKGFFVLSSEEVGGRAQEKYGRILSYIVLFVMVIFSVVFGFLTYDFLLGNINFQKSLVFASQNNGQQTYQYQSNVLNTFTGKYVDAYFRVFSQTNLALANSLAQSVPQGTKPSPQTTQTIYTLVQQSINAGRNATNVSPSNAINWQNLSTIYRSLIGFGQNADSFAILAAQQSVQLDPTNPQEYINLGGIYYQLKIWDKAEQQFQQAINLKADNPNSYYNLGHVLQEKGDLPGAKAQYEIVESLVKNDPVNLNKIKLEILAVQHQIDSQGETSLPKTNLEVNQPASSLPPQNPPLKIPGPTTSVTPTPKQSPTPTP